MYANHFVNSLYKHLPYFFFFKLCICLCEPFYLRQFCHSGHFLSEQDIEKNNCWDLHNPAVVMTESDAGNCL